MWLIHSQTRRNMPCCFCIGTQTFLSTTLRTRPTPAKCARTTTWLTTRASMSEPFPQPDVFSQPHLVFNTPTWTLIDARPELVGSLLWVITLYLGVFGPRWSSVVYKFLRVQCGLPTAAVDVLHSAPALFCGFAIDGLLRAASDGNAIGAIATGLSGAFYAGACEAGRQNATRSQIQSDDERELFNAFVAFADIRLRRRGRCHLVDVRKALEKEPSIPCRRLARRNDAQIKKFVRQYAKDSRISPNGFYRGLSVVSDDNGANRSAR